MQGAGVLLGRYSIGVSGSYSHATDAVVNEKVGRLVASAAASRGVTKWNHCSDFSDDLVKKSFVGITDV